MKDIVRLLSYVLIIIAMIGCSHRPAFPPPLDLSVYELRQFEEASAGDGDSLTIDIAGARLANDGLYLDLVAHCESVHDLALRRATRLGLFVSTEKDPSKYIRIIDERGEDVRLLPMQRPLIEGSHVHYADPPTYQLDDHRIIQVCILRTATQLEPGEYKLQLTDAWNSDSPLARLGDPVTNQWAMRKLDWASSSTIVHGSRESADTLGSDS